MLKQMLDSAGKKWWIDENNNIWNCEKFSENDAKEASKSLTDCQYCMDCVDCHGCYECKGCTRCTICCLCICCVDCTGCIDCQGCKGAELLTEARLLPVSEFNKSYQQFRLRAVVATVAAEKLKVNIHITNKENPEE